MAIPNEQIGVGFLAPGTLVDGRYKVVRFIGQGGSGAVYEVEHALTGRKLAMKCLLDEASYGRLEQEARAASLLKSARAVKVTDMGKSGPQGPYLVMELLEGQSLRALLAEMGKLPLKLIINIAEQVCECLAEAHGHGIVHRDLKPENIFLCAGSIDAQYDVKVLDFGVVKIASDSPIPSSSLTRTGSTVGTPYYMSLEQLRNSSNVDARTDVYALSVVLYEALSGKKPYQAETLADLVYALALGPPPPLARLRPDLPDALCREIMRALSASRELRPASIRELAERILPYGDAVFGAWLRAGRTLPAAPRSQARTPNLPPSNAGPIMGDTSSFPAAVDMKIEAPENDDDAAAPSSSRGNRDTPTSLYVKALHDPDGDSKTASFAFDPEAHKSERSRDTPTQAFDPAQAYPSRVSVAQTLLAPNSDVTEDLPPEYQATSRPATASVSHPRPQPLSRPPRADTVQGLGFMATQAAPRPDLDALKRAAAAGYPDAPFGFVPPVTPPPPLAFAPTMMTPVRAPPPPRNALERALIRLSTFLEGCATAIYETFRRASPNAQIAIVMVGASIAASILILILFLLLR